MSTTTTNTANYNIMLYISLTSVCVCVKIRATDVEWNDGIVGNKVVVYVAKNSHASYTKEGTWWRFWIGLANDVTGKGHRWEPDSFVFLKENEPIWMKYRGKFGLYVCVCVCFSFILRRTQNMLGNGSVDALVNQGFWHSLKESKASWLSAIGPLSTCEKNILRISSLFVAPLVLGILPFSLYKSAQTKNKVFYNTIFYMCICLCVNFFFD